MTENEIGKIVVDTALGVHRDLGPGLLESVYEVILARELQLRGLDVQRQVPMPIEYCADIIVEGKVILELKSVEQVSGAHKKRFKRICALADSSSGFCSTSVRLS